eukprot:2895165-Karenia_brevis.AAC.1
MPGKCMCSPTRKLCGLLDRQRKQQWNPNKQHQRHPPLPPPSLFALITPKQELGKLNTMPKLALIQARAAAETKAAVADANEKWQRNIMAFMQSQQVDNKAQRQAMQQQTNQ